MHSDAVEFQSFYSLKSRENKNNDLVFRTLHCCCCRGSMQQRKKSFNSISRCCIARLCLCHLYTAFLFTVDRLATRLYFPLFTSLFFCIVVEIPSRWWYFISLLGKHHRSQLFHLIIFICTAHRLLFRDGRARMEKTMSECGEVVLTGACRDSRVTYDTPPGGFYRHWKSAEWRGLNDTSDIELN